MGWVDRAKMENFTSLLLTALLLLILLTRITGSQHHYTRADFPPDFIFGSGTSAVQYEGAAFVDGKTPSIVDTFAQAGGLFGANTDVSCDGYHKYKEDIKLMVNMGLDAFRISISWPRLIPSGRGDINPKGLNFYNNLFDEMIRHGIQPHITLHHLDLPQVLQDEYGGWLSRKIVDDFVAFADVCFREFGDRVVHWTTLNEINIVAIGGYSDGNSPPARCSNRSICASGDSAREPYLAVHNMLLSHSAAAKLYKEKYKATQNGEVGLSIYMIHFDPYTNATEDVLATQRANDFHYGWVLNPLFDGDYPDTVKERVQDRLPSFTKHESEQIKGSSDFIGINHYFSLTIKDGVGLNHDFYADIGMETRGDLPYFDDEYPVRPDGLKKALEYLKQAYGNPPIYIHENGQKLLRNGTLNDTSRVEYMQAYIGSVLDAIRNGSNTKGYFAWTLLDCMELLDGYISSFGMYYIDMDDIELTRQEKLSARWYSNFLMGKSVAPNKLRKDKYVDQRSHSTQ